LDHGARPDEVGRGSAWLQRSRNVKMCPQGPPPPAPGSEEDARQGRVPDGAWEGRGGQRYAGDARPTLARAQGELGRLSPALPSTSPRTGSRRPTCAGWRTRTSPYWRSEATACCSSTLLSSATSRSTPRRGRGRLQDPQTSRSAPKPRHVLPTSHKRIVYGFTIFFWITATVCAGSNSGCVLEAKSNLLTFQKWLAVGWPPYQKFPGKKTLG
jgi:hypothetical protein